MRHKNRSLSGVPANIITGFLGVGKTSMILQLLRDKPENENWAVLVNEFGEIGIDGALFTGQYSEQNGVFIREVPGGCMCCTSGLPMRVALAELLRRARPDRLLIEPTGLGHPKEVLQTLNDADFSKVLTIQSIITLVDPRHLSDRRYREHETFQQQLDIADVIVANKQDIATKKDKKALREYFSKRRPDLTTLIFTEHGIIEPSLLTKLDEILPSTGPDVRADVTSDSDANEYQATLETVKPNVEAPLPDCGYLKAVNKGEGFVSIGWRFSSDFVFDRAKLFVFLSAINTERLKATFITQDGCFAYNYARHTLTENSFDQLDQSRIEIIACHSDDGWEQALFSCLCNQNIAISTT